MKYLVSILVLLLSFAGSAIAQPFFIAGMGAGSSSNVDAGSGSLGASVGPGAFLTGGAAGGVAGSGAASGAAVGPGPSLTFYNGGFSGALTGSGVAGASNGQAAGGSAAGATGSASHTAFGGLLFVLP